MDELLKSGFELRTMFEGELFWCELFLNGMSMTGEWDGATRAEAEAACVKRWHEMGHGYTDIAVQP